jgi:hypothetical protein
MKIPDKIRISLVCLFCGVTLEAPEDTTYASGDLVNCKNCGEDNDYDSLVEVAKEKGIKELSDSVQDHLKKEFKKIFK